MNWSFDGTALSDFGIVVVMDEFFDIPARRGDNLLIPYRHGKVFSKKFYDSRILSLGLTLEHDSLTNLETTYDDLKRLLSGRTEKILQVEMDGGQTRTARASVDRVLGSNLLGAALSKIVIDFVLADPFFRSTSLTSEEVEIDTSPKDFDLENAGTVEERDPTITLTGPLENTRIENTTNGVILQYNGVIADGEVVVIATDPATGNYTALLDGVTNVIGNVAHSGDTALLVLETGVNELVITDDEATTGTITFDFYPPYL